MNAISDYQQLDQQLAGLTPFSPSAVEISCNSPTLFDDYTNIKECVLPILQDIEKLPDQMTFKKIRFLYEDYAEAVVRELQVAQTQSGHGDLPLFRMFVGDKK